MDGVIPGDYDPTKPYNIAKCRNVEMRVDYKEDSSVEERLLQFEQAKNECIAQRRATVQRLKTISEYMKHQRRVSREISKRITAVKIKGIKKVVETRFEDQLQKEAVAQFHETMALIGWMNGIDAQDVPRLIHHESRVEELPEDGSEEHIRSRIADFVNTYGQPQDKMPQENIDYMLNWYNENETRLYAVMGDFVHEFSTMLIYDYAKKTGMTQQHFEGKKGFDDFAPLELVIDIDVHDSMTIVVHNIKHLVFVLCGLYWCCTNETP
jgi:hypothetical protein